MLVEKVQYLRREQVDVVKWDRCINEAANGLIYGYAMYLDHMAKHWDALVMGDYQAVMPLTWNKKYGLYYLYQPAFAACLGVFGNGLTEEVINRFLSSIPFKFRLVEISLNTGNMRSSQLPFVTLRSNYILYLNKPYQNLYGSFRENTRRNIAKARQYGARHEFDVPMSKIIDLSKQNFPKLTRTNDKDYIHFEELYSRLQKENRAITSGVYLSDELVASAVYFFSHQRAYYILVGNHPNGKTIGASHFMIDRFIHSYAEQDLILDFEGSDIRSLAFFYSSFGATVETYPSIRINNLPWWAKILKR